MYNNLSNRIIIDINESPLQVI